MRIQTPGLVGKCGETESPQGAHQEQDQGNQDAGAKRYPLWYVLIRFILRVHFQLTSRTL